MPSFTENFLEKHKSWLDRNREYLLSSDWHLENVIESPDEETSVFSKNKTRNKRQTGKLANDSAIVDNIVKRLKYFIKNTAGEKHLSSNKKVVKMMLEIIIILTDNCEKYLENTRIINIDDLRVKNMEIKFQDLVFNLKIKIEDALDDMGAFMEHEDIKIKFFKDAKASLVMREPLILLNDDIKLITESSSFSWEPVSDSKEMYINMKPKDIPLWNSKRHFFEQEQSTVDFWLQELHKIQNGITIGGFFMHPWLYFHLNFFRTPIPQQDGSEPTIQPGLRDNEWFFAESLKQAVNKENPAYYSKALLIYGTRRFAKALRNDQVLHYVDGITRPIGNARVGDVIIGSDSKPTKITNVSPQGVKPLYKVILSDNRESICCDEHLWKVYDKQAKRYKTLPLKEIMNSRWTYDRVIGEKIHKMYNFALPIGEGVEFKDDFIDIDPYYLGSWLGDGSSNNTAITSEDTPTFRFLEDYANKLGLTTRYERRNNEDNCCTIHLVGKSGKKNPLLEKLRSLNLIRNKHIPEKVFTKSKRIRLAILQGLLDTDGTIGKSGSGISFTNANKTLAYDVLRLCRSLGIHSYAKDLEGNYLKKDGEINTYTKITLFTTLKVFRLSRKLNRQNNNNTKIRNFNAANVNIVDIVSTTPAQATCITVDNTSKEFLTNDYIVTHNSVILASLAHWRTLTKFNSFGSIIGGSSSDLSALTSKVQTSMTFIENAFKLDILKKNWESGVTDFGIKADMHNSIVFSSLIVQNLQAGAKSKTQATAGLAPSVSIYDEIGKYPFLASYLAALPSFKTPFGFKCVTVLAGTGGSADLSADAMQVLGNPEAFDLLPMDFGLLEHKVDPEFITWKPRKFATFFPGQMAYEDGFKKISTPLGNFLDIKNKKLNEINIDVTDWEHNIGVIRENIKKAESVKGSKGKLLAQQKKVQYPIDPEDCFITIEGNPFPSDEAKKHKERLLETGDLGRKVLLRKDSQGIIHADEANHLELAEYPHNGGNVDAPVMLYEGLPSERPPFGLYVAGLDDYKHDSSDGDSVGSMTIYKRQWFDPWSLRIVASYHSRPHARSKFDRQCYYMLKAFNAVCFHENADNNFKTFLDNRHEAELYLAKGMDFASELNLHNNGNRVYGWHPTEKNINFGYSLIKKNLEEEVTVVDEKGEKYTTLGVERIPDIGMLEEIQNFTKDGNFDRLRSFMGALMYSHYLDTIYMLPKPPTRKSTEERHKSKAKLKKRVSPYRKDRGRRGAYR